MKTYDFVAVGAGPSNLSLAVQAFEGKSFSTANFLILEKNEEVEWHPGMLLPGSRLDTHFAKDLVTMVNPKSDFSFLNFLSVHNRLEAFLNCGTPHPYRAEFNEYLRWTASVLAENIRTGFEVRSIEQRDDGRFRIDVKKADGSQIKLMTRNVVLGMGGAARMICGLKGNETRVIHSSEFLQKLSTISDTRSKKFLIVGAGQSGGEIAQYLLANTSSEIHMSLSDYALTAKEGTAFVNESYNGDFVDRFYSMSAEMKEWFTAKRQNMNYGVVDDKVISALYNENYYGKYHDNRCVKFLPFSRVIQITAGDNNVSVAFENRENGTVYDDKYEYIVLATGYKADLAKNVLSDMLGPEELCVNRDFSIKHEKLLPGNGVYLNGNVSASHGPAEDVLSVIAHRSRDILQSIEKCQIMSECTSSHPVSTIRSEQANMFYGY